MNVRFFAGTKAEYLSLQSPRNPHGLYFCADTHELFWGDKLLSDGIRVVATRADLPSLDSAAEGVVYYITETRNGYTLSPDRTEWLQTIYAPIRKGEAVPEGEEDNTVTTVGAVRQLAGEIYKYIDDQIKTVTGADLSGLVTKEDLEAAIAAIELDDYATKDYIHEQINAIPEVYLSEYAKKSDLANLATTEFVIQKIAEAELNDKEVDLSSYATNDALAAVEAKIPSTEGLATEHYVDTKLAEVKVPTKVSALENDAGYITANDIPDAELYKIDFNAPSYADAISAYKAGKVLVLINAAPDVNSYAMMNYVSDKCITFTKFLMSRSETYGAFNTYYLKPDNTWEISKEVKLNNVEANIDVDSDDAAELTSIKVGKDFYRLDGYATKEAVSEALENYTTTHELNTTYVTNETLHNNYITQQEIANTYVTEQHIVQNYITQEAAAETYVTTERVTEVVETQVNEVVMKEIETKVETVVQEKVDAGEIAVKAESVSYDTW